MTTITKSEYYQLIGELWLVLDKFGLSVMTDISIYSIIKNCITSYFEIEGD